MRWLDTPIRSSSNGEAATDLDFIYRSVLRYINTGFNDCAGRGYNNKYDNIQKGTCRMIYCCLEDVDLALESVVDETQLAPIIEQIPEDKRLSTRCEYCGDPAVYVVTNSYSHT